MPRLNPQKLPSDYKVFKAVAEAAAFLVKEKENMDKPIMLNTMTEFEFCDGTKTKLTLAFYHLYKLRNNHKELYNRYNKIVQETNAKNMDILDMVTMCYVAYVCAHIDEEEILTEEEFMILCGSDMNRIGEAVKMLFNPKKQKASDQHS